MELRPYIFFTRVFEAELEGILHASPRVVRAMSPYFEVVRRERDKREGTDRRLSAVVDQIVEVWRGRGPAYIEIFDPDALNSGWWSAENPIVLFYEALRQRGVSAVPTTALDRTGEYRDAFVRAVRLSRTGLGVRLYVDDLEVPTETIEKARTLATEANCTLRNVDVLINFERILSEHLPQLRARTLDFMAELDRRGQCRSVTVIGSSVPQSVSDVVKEDSSAIAQRLELRLWRELATARRTHGLVLRLGDYGIVKPEYVERGGPFPNINGRIFYTFDEGTLVLRGKSRINESLEDQYLKLTHKLTRDIRFLGGAFSWGDQWMESCAKFPAVPGNPTKWIAACTSHHIELVSAQVDRLVEIAR